MKTKQQKKKIIRKPKQAKSIISDDIFIPNHSGMLDAGKVHRTPTEDLDPVNKKYVDDIIDIDPYTIQSKSFGAFDQLNFENTDSGCSCIITYTTRDGDGTDDVFFGIYGVGNVDDWVNAELLRFGYGSTNQEFYIGAAKGGTGTDRDLKIYAGDSNADKHIRLTAAGDMTFGDVSGIPTTIKTSGKVGVGTSDPKGRFHSSDGTTSGLAGTAGIGFGDVTLTNNLGANFVMEDIGGTTGLRVFRMAYGSGEMSIDSLNNAGTSFVTRGILKATYDGKVGVDMGAAAPTLPLDVKAKSGMSAIGGICIKLTNKTGANSVAGQLLKADTATNDAVILTAADELENVGVFLDSGVADGSEAWVVISGIADVAMEDNTAATRGNWVRSSSSEAGYSDATNATPPSPASFTHFAEIGHCIESVAAGGAGTHILARIIMHFN